MQPEEAVDLLAWGLPFDAVQAHRGAFQQLARRLGEWPLLLTLVNRTLREEVNANSALAAALEYINQGLDEEGIEAFDLTDQQSRDTSVQRTLEASLSAFTVAEQARYAELAAFPDNVDVPLAMVTQLWGSTGGLDDFTSEELCGEFAAHALLLRCDLDQRTIRTHTGMQRSLQRRSWEQLPHCPDAG